MKSPTKHITFSCLLYFLLFLINSTGCDNSTPPSPTPLCDVTISELPTSAASPRPNLYFVYIENSNPYQQYLAQTQKVLPTVLNNTLLPGDRLIVGWLDNGVRTRLRSSVIMFDSSLKATSYSVQFPTPVPTPRIFLVPTLPTTPYTQIGEKKATEEANAVNERNAKAAQDYSCALATQIAEIETLKVDARTINAAAVSAFTAPLSQLASQFPSGLGEKNSKPILEALILASDLMKTEGCNEGSFGHCILLIFSDMYDYRMSMETPIPEGLPVPNLERIDLGYILYDCRYESDCESKNKNWTRILTKYQAQSIKHFINAPNSSIVDDITAYIAGLRQNPNQ